MIIYPAIDLLDGRCVRLLQGDYSQVTTFDGDPLDTALRWRDAGASWLHIIDLSGARVGAPQHLDLVARIVAATNLPVRLGGGMRTADDVAAAFAAGLARVTLGTAALDAVLLATLTARWGDRIEVALDRRGDIPAVAGWQQTAAVTLPDWTRRATDAGVRSFLVTDIDRDGTQSGANAALVAQTRRDAGTTPIAVTVAGGVTTIDDIRALAQAGADGAVIGKALYSGRIDLALALATAKEETAC